MTWEVGKSYKTKSNEKACVIGFKPSGESGAFPIVGLVEGSIVTWSKDGMCSSRYLSDDLTLEEWLEVKRIEPLDIKSETNFIGAETFSWSPKVMALKVNEIINHINNQSEDK